MGGIFSKQKRPNAPYHPSYANGGGAQPSPCYQSHPMPACCPPEFYSEDDTEPFKLEKNNVAKFGGSKAGNAGISASSLAALTSAANGGLSARPTA
ncbi:unnamed protein product [Mortierella alpina]